MSGVIGEQCRARRAAPRRRLERGGGTGYGWSLRVSCWCSNNRLLICTQAGISFSGLYLELFGQRCKLRELGFVETCWITWSIAHIHLEFSIMQQDTLCWCPACILIETNLYISYHFTLHACKTYFHEKNKVIWNVWISVVELFIQIFCTHKNDCFEIVTLKMTVILKHKLNVGLYAI